MWNYSNVKLLPNWRSFRKVLHKLNPTILTTFFFLLLQIKRKAIKNPGKSTGDLPDFLSAFLNRSCPFEIQEPDLSCDRWYFTLPLCETRVWSEKVHKTKHSHTQKHWQTNTDSTLIIIHHPLISIITWSSRDETEQQGSRSLEAGSCESNIAHLMPTYCTLIKRSIIYWGRRHTVFFYRVIIGKGGRDKLDRSHSMEIRLDGMRNTF